MEINVEEGVWMGTPSERVTFGVRPNRWECVMWRSREQHSRQREERMLKSGGGKELGLFTEENGDQCGWIRANKSAGTRGRDKSCGQESVYAAPGQPSSRIWIMTQSCRSVMRVKWAPMCLTDMTILLTQETVTPLTFPINFMPSYHAHRNKKGRISL